MTIVSATSAFAQGIPSEDEFPPGQGPSFNAVGGLEHADANAKAKGKKGRVQMNDIVIVKLLDKASPS